MSPPEIRQIIAEKVTGVWVAEHTAEGHFYRNTKTGTLCPSVTTKQKIIDKPHLKKWAVKKGIEYIEQFDRFEKLKGPERNIYMMGAQDAHMEESQEAADAGTLCHAVIEKYVLYWITNGRPPEDIRKAFLPDADPKAIAGARAAERLFRENPQIVPVATELLVGSDDINCAGTLDLLVFNIETKELEVWDWKLTNSIEDGYAAQVSTYKGMFEDMTDLVVARIKVFQLSKQYDKFNRYKVSAPAYAYKAMKGLSMYYDYLYGVKPKIERDIIKINLNTKYGNNKLAKQLGGDSNEEKRTGSFGGEDTGTAKAGN